MQSVAQQIKQQVRQCHIDEINDLPAFLAEQTAPIVIKDVCALWPMVKQAKQSNQQALSYLKSLASNSPVRAFSAPAQEQGRYFYNAQMDGFNFSQYVSNLVELLEQLEQVTAIAEPDSYYMGSTACDYCAPDFNRYNPLLVTAHKCLKSLWVGNHSQIAAHYDNADNLACVGAGSREFILFAPEQVDNLYIGPLEFTPAGQAVSLVDFTAPDFERFPRFKQALNSAQIAKLTPGDGIFIPALWWHHVSAQSVFNVLVNYWWRQAADHLANPFDALLHSMLAIKDLPANHKTNWQQLFNHYVFNDNVELGEHTPDNVKGILGKVDELTARKIRQLLLQKLNR
ncbi:cupin-like domain-containing protein [Pseudoalteromonas haloplanktis]|uniref:Cupin-like domain-containing protein n=1 Tax=Pseudoalteromonas haloplanktis TaxID=228 RepID=A0ABU1BDA8_PSEHA|nr:cupin-like domain-containing protein [Pseudoalteromonas haloplanktis]MDQ9092365.1 cupin-like domain-containing protein [Pseudoalteromonas haloplanktis]